MTWPQQAYIPMTSWGASFNSRELVCYMPLCTFNSQSALMYICNHIC